MTHRKSDETIFRRIPDRATSVFHYFIYKDGFALFPHIRLFLNRLSPKRERRLSHARFQV